MSDDDSPPKKVKPIKQITEEDDEDHGNPSKALDNLLNSSPSRSAKKKHEPTMLDKIMAGKATGGGGELNYFIGFLNPSPTTHQPTHSRNTY